MQQDKLRILVIAKPKLGDILLATPLIRSIREQQPAAVIDLLVYSGQEDIVEGCTDINTVLAIDHHPSIRTLWSLARKYWRKYDIAITTGSDDRAHVYLWLFGKKRVSVAPQTRTAWKRWITYATFFVEEGTHTLLQNNSLGNLLGYKSGFTICPPRINSKKNAEFSLLDDIDLGEPFAILQLDASLPQKRWTRDGWCDVAEYLSDNGIKSYLIGGGGETEKKYLNEAMRSMPASTVNLSGKTRFAEASELIAACSIYVGIDTVNTHIAAAHGVPTIALFGPGNPYTWGPWPMGHAGEKSPWTMYGSQRLGNVMIVKRDAACERCEKQNCLELKNKVDGCTQMTSITSKQVIRCMKTLLAEKPLVGGCNER